MIEFLLWSVPILSFCAGLLLLALGTLELTNPAFRFWPPPEDQRWKKIAFFVLFRALVYGLVIASVTHLWRSGFEASLPLNVLSILLILIGFIIAFAATGALGWANAFGTKEGLKTGGIFKYSRNPIYIATWLALAGWAILVPKPIIIATLLVWGLLYLVAIFIEERWLIKEYGEAFREYRNNVPRFF